MFHDAAVFQHDQAIHAGDGRQAVGDGDDGAALHEGFQLALNGGFDLGIECRGGFVQHQDGGVFQDHSGDGDALALAAGEFDAAFADMGVKAGAVVPVFKLFDEGGRLGLIGGGADFGFGGPGAAVADVVADRPVQQRGILGYHGDLGAQAFLGDAGDVLAVDYDAAGFGAVEAEQQVDQGGFAGAGMADQADALARCDVEVEVVQDTACRTVAEADVVEADGALLHVQFGGAVGVGHLARHGDGAHAFLHHADIFEDHGDVVANPAGHVGDLPGQRQRHGHRADADLARLPEPQRCGAGGHHQGGVEQVERDDIARGQAQLAAVGGGVLVDRLAHEIVLVAGAGEEFDGEDVGVAVNDAPGEGRAHLAHGAAAVAHARHEVAQHEAVGDEPEQHRDRQPCVGVGQQQHCAGAVNDDVPDGIGGADHAFAQGRAGLHHPVGDAAGEIVLEEAPGLPHHVPVILPAYQVHQAGGDRLVGDQNAQQQRGRAQHGHHRGHGEQLVPVLAEDCLGRHMADQLDHAADHHGDGDVEQRHQQAGAE